MSPNSSLNSNLSDSACVVFSGGQDSTTCLFWAKAHFKNVICVFFDYGQKHLIEWESAQKIAQIANVPLKKLSIDTFRQIGQNALVDHELVIEDNNENGLPSTFVPGRNLIFLTLAASYAYTQKIYNIVTGVCQTDYSGYPDCRQNTMESLEKMLCLGMEQEFKIITPLMWMNKAETIQLAQKHGALNALAWSHTCYEGQFPPCMKCPSCLLRQKGFDEAGIADPIFSRV
jgi:7-cyano-7-deazaguanine synthase